MKTLADYTYVVMPDDDQWLAYVPAIPGCHAAGDSPEEARSELEHVLAMFGEDIEQTGQPWPEDVKELVAVAS